MPDKKGIFSYSEKEMMDWPEKFSSLRKRTILLKAKKGLFHKPFLVFCTQSFKKKVVFLYETSKLKGENYKKSREIFKNIITAMKIPSNNYVIVEFSKEDIQKIDFSKNLLKKISTYNPSIVLCFGVLASSMFLEREKRPGQIHGKFFKRSLPTSTGQCRMEIVSIFHPDILCINQNMKRTTWLDIQKVMAFLNIS